MIPDHVDFGLGHIRVVQYVPDRQMRELADCDPDDETPDGLWDTDTDTVYLRKGLRGAKKRRVFWHEMVHAVMDLGYESGEPR